MELESIQSFIEKGYELRINQRAIDRGKFHAFVHLGDVASSHHYLGGTADAALVGLNEYLRALSDSAGVKADGG